ncbi:MAG: HAMP domain-containing histidine kinase [Lawsonibacter sp.]|nr:HAMP domain-containing histidine kinase [Lawsonibacter sp.]
MSLRRAFFLLAFCGLLTALALAALLWMGCRTAASRYPLGGVSIGSDGIITPLPQPTPEQLRLLLVLDVTGLLGWILFPVMGLAVSGALFYRWKLKEPSDLLLEGTRRIQAHDLDFTLPAVSGDELGQICAAFESMRRELLKTNRELWRQAEERRRLNAAFAHDLRNPVTVLKGSIKLLRQGPPDPQALDRLESYTARIEAYVEAMSSIQRLEQMPVRTAAVPLAVLRSELEETARLLAPALEASVRRPGEGTAEIDHGIFLTVAENLIGNGARFAKQRLEITLTLEESVLSLSVADDGPGFPDQLLKGGPRPFERLEKHTEHFGMGLYTSGLLCRKHGGSLCLKNSPSGGAVAAAAFQTNYKS